MNRYKSARKATNTSTQYENLFEDRDVKFIEQYRTEGLRDPTDKEIDDLESKMKRAVIIANAENLRFAQFLKRLVHKLFMTFFAALVFRRQV